MFWQHVQATRTGFQSCSWVSTRWVFSNCLSQLKARPNARLLNNNNSSLAFLCSNQQQCSHQHQHASPPQSWVMRDLIYAS